MIWFLDLTTIVSYHSNIKVQSDIKVQKDEE